MKPLWPYAVGLLIGLGVLYASNPSEVQTAPTSGLHSEISATTSIPPDAEPCQNAGQRIKKHFSNVEMNTIQSAMFREVLNSPHLAKICDAVEQAPESDLVKRLKVVIQTDSTLELYQLAGLEAEHGKANQKP